MNFILSQKSLGKPLTKIITVMKNIGLTKPPYRTIIIPERHGASSDQMDHDFPTLWSWLFNSLFSSTARKQEIILLGNIHVYRQDIYVKRKSIRLSWYHQNTHYLDGHHSYVTLENDTNTIDIQEVRHTLTTQGAGSLQ